MGLAHGAADLHRNFFHDLFRDHTTDCVRNPRDDRLGNHTADGHRTRLSNNLGLIRGAGNLSFDDVGAPDSFAGVEARHPRHAELRTTGSTHQFGTAGTGVVDLLLGPLATILSLGPIRGDGSHDRVAPLLIDHFVLLSHDGLTTFALKRFRNGPLNTTSDFPGTFVPDLPLSCVSLITIKRLRNGLHHRVSLFAIRGLVDLSCDLILLFPVGHFVDDSIVRFLHVIEDSFIHCSTDGVRLRLLNRLVHRALTHLSLDTLCGVAAGLLTRIRWTASVTRGSAITPGRNSSR